MNQPSLREAIVEELVNDYQATHGGVKPTNHMPVLEITADRLVALVEKREREALYKQLEEIKSEIWNGEKPLTAINNAAIRLEQLKGDE